MKQTPSTFSYPCQISLLSPSAPPSEIVPELIPSKGSVCNCTAKQDSPYTRNDGTDREDEDVDTREYKWLIGCYDEGLDWWLYLRSSRCNDIGENTRYKRCFLRGECGIDFLAGAICSSKGDGWNQDVLQIGPDHVSDEKQNNHSTYVPMFALMRSALICPTNEYSFSNVGAAPACLFGHEIKEVGSSRRRRLFLSTADTVAPIYDRPTCMLLLGMFANDPVGSEILYIRKSASNTPVLLLNSGKL